jgi:hypothetical protein
MTKPDFYRDKDGGPITSHPERPKTIIPCPKCNRLCYEGTTCDKCKIEIK